MTRFIQRHRQLLTAGTGWQSVDRIIEQPFFMVSKYSVHIQLADILSYNVMRHARDGGYGDGNAYAYYTRILPKCRGYNSWYGGNMRALFGCKLEL